MASPVSRRDESGPAPRDVVLPAPDDFAAWRRAARALVLEGVPPEAVTFRVEGEAPDLLAGGTEPPTTPAPAGATAFTVPRAFLDLAEQVALHREPARFALLYRLLWRLRAEPGLMEVAFDADVSRATELVKAVRRDIHKMRAFVRFREVETPEGPRFVAWFEPDHFIVRANAPFFVRRFAAMRWSILTPDACAHWEGRIGEGRIGDGATGEAVITPGATRADAAGEDGLEETWRTYYASIFNPARLKVAAMRAEMPQKYWHNLPEAALIKPLIEAARPRMEAFVTDGATDANPKPQKAYASARTTADPIEAGEPVPMPSPGEDRGEALQRLREAAEACRRCPLWEPATQTVFGDGLPTARILVVGEQPGDQEDLAGKPFVGPAGRLFDRALAEAGVKRERLYVTNAVKHFKFVPRGKFRLHQKPNTSEIKACRPWLEAERVALRPELILAMGGTAVQSIVGKAVSVTSLRGQVHALPTGERMYVTVHPSYLLRLPDEAAKEAEYRRFVRELAEAASLVPEAA